MNNRSALVLVIICSCWLQLPIFAADIATLQLVVETTEDGNLKLFGRPSKVRPLPGLPEGDCFKYVIPCPKNNATKKQIAEAAAAADWAIHAALHEDLTAKLKRPDNALGRVIWIEGPARGKLDSADFVARKRDWSVAVSEAKSVKIGDVMKQFWSIELGKALPEKSQVQPIVRPGRKGCWVRVPCGNKKK